MKFTMAEHLEGTLRFYFGISGKIRQINEIMNENRDPMVEKREYHTDVNTGETTLIIAKVHSSTVDKDSINVEVEMVGKYKAHRKWITMDKPKYYETRKYEWHNRQENYIELNLEEINGDVVSVRTPHTGENTLAIYVNGNLKELHEEIELDEYVEILNNLK